MAMPSPAPQRPAGAPRPWTNSGRPSTEPISPATSENGGADSARTRPARGGSSPNPSTSRTVRAGRSSAMSVALLLEQRPDAPVQHAVLGQREDRLDVARPRQVDVEHGADAGGPAGEHVHAVGQVQRLLDRVRDEHDGLVRALPDLEQL